MPFVATRDGDRVLPTEVTDGSTVTCPACEGEMGVRGPFKRNGVMVARHFFHHNNEQKGCGESDKHIKMKAIAASVATDLWPGCEVEVEASVGDRRADVLVTFEERDDRLLDGVAIEVQHKNVGKDKWGTEVDYADHDYSTLWVTDDAFTGLWMNVDDGELCPAWPKKVPRQGKWTHPQWSPSWDGQLTPWEYEIPATFHPWFVTEETKDKERYWNLLGSSDPAVAMGLEVHSAWKAGHQQHRVEVRGKRRAVDKLVAQLGGDYDAVREVLDRLEDPEPGGPVASDGLDIDPVFDHLHTRLDEKRAEVKAEWKSTARTVTDTAEIGEMIELAIERFDDDKTLRHDVVGMLNKRKAMIEGAEASETKETPTDAHQKPDVACGSEYDPCVEGAHEFVGVWCEHCGFSKQSIVDWYGQAI